jgi:hypothetical protein
MSALPQVFHIKSCAGGGESHFSDEFRASVPDDRMVELDAMASFLLTNVHRASYDPEGKHGGFIDWQTSRERTMVGLGKGTMKRVLLREAAEAGATPEVIEALERMPY